MTIAFIPMLKVSSAAAEYCHLFSIQISGLEAAVVSLDDAETSIEKPTNDSHDCLPISALLADTKVLPQSLHGCEEGPVQVNI